VRCDVAFLIDELFAPVEDSSSASWDRVIVDWVVVGGNNQPHCARPLARDHGRPGKEDLVEAVCKLTVLLNNSLLVLYNVVVPLLDGMGVMNTLVAHAHDLKATPFQLTSVPVHRAGGIGTWEDILTHEVAPNEIFVSPVAAEPGNLQEEDAIGLKECLNLGHIILVVADANMLTHLEAGNLIELAPLVSREFSVVEQVNLYFALKAFLLYSALSPFKLAGTNSHTGALDIKILTDVNDPC